VFGSVTVNQVSFEPGRSSQPRPMETPVRLTGGGRELSMVSANGRFEFSGLSPGLYRVYLQLPEGYSTYSESREVHIPNSQACAREDYYLSPAGRITGRAVGSDGRPVPRVRIEVTDPDARPHSTYGLLAESATTDADGYFEVGRLPPGRYIVGVNLADLPSQYNPYGRTLYPSEGPDPHVLTLSLGQTMDVGTWRLPPALSVVRVVGVVTWQDGTAAVRISIGAWDRTGNPVEWARGAGNAWSGPDGRFVIELREGRVYDFKAGDGRGASLPISAPRIETNGPLKPIRIVILKEPPGGDVSPGRDP
jgi:hypothetical protein